MSEPTNEKGAGGDAPAPLRLSVAKSPARRHANSMITASTARLSPGLALTLDHAVALGAQDVLHLHGLDDAQRLARLDLLRLRPRGSP